MQSIINPNNTWGLWAILLSVACCAIFLEQKYRWASKITGCIIALLATMLLSNIHLIPVQSTVYDDVWTYVVPLAIPLLLFQCNIKKIGKESGRLLFLYLLSSMGTIIGAITGFFLLPEFIPDLYKTAAMFTGSYVGGSVNLAAMSDSFNVSPQLVSAAVIADNLLMAIYFFALIAICSLPFFLKHYKHPLIDKNENIHGNVAAAYWQPKPIALKDIAFNFAATVSIVAISSNFANFLSVNIPKTNASLDILNSLLGNKYLIMTSITMLLATFLPQKFNNSPGATEIGTFLIYIFFAVIGAPASIGQIINNFPLLIYAFIIVTINLIFTLVIGKIFGFHLEEIILASNANIGGPTTAAAMAISKGWSNLVGPVLLIGTLGYILGNYYGIFIGNLLK